MAKILQINLFDKLPITIIDDILKDKQFINGSLIRLYNLSYIIRSILINLKRTNNLKYIQGKIYAFGNGEYGNLGDNNITKHAEGIPTLIDLKYFRNDEAGINERIISISTGLRHVLVLTESGHVYAFGSRENGVLGDNHDDSRVGIPLIINPDYFNNRKIIAISAGMAHSLVLTTEGEVYAFGNGEGGRLGDNDISYHQVLIPLKINPEYFYNEKIISISGGSSHTLVLTKTGKVYAFGDGWNGELGDGGKGRRNASHLVGVPKEINPKYFNNEKIISISAGGSHSLILAEDGDVYAFGLGLNGLLGDDDIKNHRVTLPLKINPKYFHSEENGVNEKIIAISSGMQHSLVLTETGQVYSFGLSQYGRLGLGDIDENDWHSVGIPLKIDPKHFADERITSISAGSFHSLVLTKTGKIYSFGRGEYGALGDNNIDEHSVGIPKEINPSYFNNEKIISIFADYEYSLVLT